MRRPLLAVLCVLLVGLPLEAGRHSYGGGRSYSSGGGSYSGRRAYGSSSSSRSYSAPRSYNRAYARPSSYSSRGRSRASASRSYGRSYSSGSHTSYRSAGTARGSRSYSSARMPRTTRSSGRANLKRDPAQRDAFQRSHPCPATGKTSGACPGYVVDHITPLAKGGADHPSNMQWQSVDAAKAKDKWERK